MHISRLTVELLQTEAGEEEQGVLSSLDDTPKREFLSSARHFRLRMHIFCGARLADCVSLTCD